MQPRTTSNIPISQKRMSTIEKIGWVITIIVGIIAIYEFVIKKIL